MGRKQAAGTEGQAYLPAVSVAAGDQVKAGVRIVCYQLRAVGEQDGKMLRIPLALAADQLAHPFFGQPQAVVGEGKCVGVIHTAQLYPLSGNDFRYGLSPQRPDAKAGEAISQSWHLPRPFLMVAGHKKAGIGGAESL